MWEMFGNKFLRKILRQRKNAQMGEKAKNI